MNSLIVKLVLGKKVGEEDIWEGLREICDDVHGSCGSDCPVYEINGYEAPNYPRCQAGCICFKNGEAMAEFIKSKRKK